MTEIDLKMFAYSRVEASSSNRRGDNGLCELKETTGGSYLIFVMS